MSIHAPIKTARAVCHAMCAATLFFTVFIVQFFATKDVAAYFQKGFTTVGDSNHNGDVTSPPQSTAALIGEGAVSSAKQHEILRVLHQNGGIADVTLLSKALNMHPNTVRGHLDSLIDGGLVSATPVKTSGRGRPALQYRVRTPQQATIADAYIDLIGLLAGTLDSGGSGITDPEGIGRAWAAARSAASGLAESQSTVSTIEALLDELAVLGFDPYIRESGEMGLCSCPFIRRDGAVPPPYICRLHAGYLRGRVGGTTVTLNPFDQPGECGISLHDGGESATAGT